MESGKILADGSAKELCGDDLEVEGASPKLSKKINYIIKTKIRKEPNIRGFFPYF